MCVSYALLYKHTEFHKFVLCCVCVFVLLSCVLRQDYEIVQSKKENERNPDFSGFIQTPLYIRARIHEQ